MRDDIDSIETIRNAIRYTAGENTSVAMFPAVVSAFVHGVTVISEEMIKVNLTIKYDCAEVGIFWEDYGYKNYKSMGLYGLMNSNYQDFIENGEHEFRIEGNGYKIIVSYKGATSSFMP